jgi:hypothetical protein
MEETANTAGSPVVVGERKQVIYLASPYSSPYKWKRLQRFLEVAKAVGALKDRGIIAFSPICHSHPVTVHYLGDDHIAFDNWKDFDTEMIRRCDALWVLMLEGWDQSEGIKAELEIAKSLGKEILYLEPGSLNPHSR